MEHNILSIELSLEDRVAIDTLIDSERFAYERKRAPKKKDFWYDRICKLQEKLKLY